MPSSATITLFKKVSVRYLRLFKRCYFQCVKFCGSLTKGAALSLILPILLATTTQAQEYQWRLTDPIPQPTCPNHPHPDCYWYGQGPLSQPNQQNQPSFLIKSIVSTFDLDTNRWTFEVVMGDNPALPDTVIPDSYWMALNHGPMPSSPGRVSMFYFDGTDPSQPKLTVYAYNASHALFDRSWLDGSNAAGIQAPDRVCTSLSTTPCGAWVSTATVEDLPSGDRKFSFDVDATSILNHTPAYGEVPTLWHRPTTGSTPRIFDQGIGIWFHVGLGRQYGYGPDGYISQVEEAPNAGYYDADWLNTNRTPECETNITLTQIRPGEVSSFSITGTDVGASTPPLAIASGDIPPVSCSQQSVGLDTTRVDCSLVGPAVSSPTSYQVSVDFTDLEGATSTCSAAVTVVNSPPTCSLTVVAQNPQQIVCEGETTTVAVDVVSSDPNMDPIIQTPSIVCSTGQSSVMAQSPSSLVASATGPGFGEQTNCTVTLEVSDGITSTSCQASFSIAPCVLDCLNEPNGTAQLDQCGVCNGTNECVDCAGTPFGTAVEDRCNVCNGDGQSCLECTPIENIGTQSALDTAAMMLNNLVRSGAGKLRLVEGRNPRTRRFIRNVTRAANEAYQRAWSAIWSVPSAGVACTNGFCVTVSNLDAVVAYDVAITDLNAAIDSVIKRLGKAGARRKRNHLRMRQATANQSVETERSAIVTSFSSC